MNRLIFRVAEGTLFLALFGCGKTISTLPLTPPSEIDAQGSLITADAVERTVDNSSSGWAHVQAVTYHWGFKANVKTSPNYPGHLELGRYSPVVVSAHLLSPESQGCQMAFEIASLDNRNTQFSCTVAGKYYDASKDKGECLKLAQTMQSKGFTVEFTNVKTEDNQVIKRLVVTVDPQ